MNMTPTFRPARTVDGRRGMFSYRIKQGVPDTLRVVLSASASMPSMFSRSLKRRGSFTGEQACLSDHVSVCQYGEEQFKKKILQHDGVVKGLKSMVCFHVGGRGKKRDPNFPSVWLRPPPRPGRPQTNVLIWVSSAFQAIILGAIAVPRPSRFTEKIEPSVVHRSLGGRLNTTPL